MRTRFARLGMVALLSVLTIGAAPQPTAAAAPAVSSTVIASGLAIPWDIAFAPDGTMMVTERIGRVRVFSGGTSTTRLLHTVNIPDVSQYDESGLMGIAVDVDFASNRYVYVCATRNYTGSGGPKNEVLRYQVDAAGGWQSGTVILGNMAASNIHNGCALEMDRFGYLWVGMGDAGNQPSAQNRNSLNGKILRMHRDGSVPGDNPLINGTRNQVYSMGHRNPQGIAFRPGTDEVYAIEHGPEKDDEINLIVAGANYGWPCNTGGSSYPPGGCSSANTTPAWASGAPTIATSGGTFVNGGQWGDWNGHLFVSTLKERDVRRFSVNGDSTLTMRETHSDNSWGRLRAAVSGPGGQLYLSTSNGTDDKIIRLSPQVPSVDRLAGQNRDATAAAISQAAYPGGAQNVMVATGSNFPDALAGSAVAGNFGMPMLLVRQNTIPQATADELQRLNPDRIFVLGGDGVVSEGVRSQLQLYANTGEAIRVSGIDRYATAAAISQRWYPTPGVPAVFVATGTAFPDALAGAPAAALNDSPLLLVKGSEIPPASAAELDRLNPQRIYILGGEGAVSASVASQLQLYTSGPVTRLWGADRYATAAAVSKAFWGRSPAYVATGTNFPDALGGGAAAGRAGLPMLLASPNGVPLPTGQELLRLGSTRLILLGGTGALSAAAEAKLRALVGTP